jgi:hypothetical protein
MYSLHDEIIRTKEQDYLIYVKQQPSIDDHVTRMRPSIFIGKEHQAHHLALSPTTL